jgi:inositol-pentakisphosphate 2-kinase
VLCSETNDDTGLLLRVAKVAHGEAPAYDYVRQQRFWTSSIQPILTDHAVTQELVILRKSDIVDQVNALLRSIDQSRKPKFRGTYVGHSDWGFLIEDMRPESTSSYVGRIATLIWLTRHRSGRSSAVRI